MTDFPQNAGGSAQLRNYRTLRRAGIEQSFAAERAGITIGEARLIDADDAKSPPAAEAFQPLTAGPAVQPKEPEMARPKKNDTPISGEVPKPDFDLAVRIWRQEIKPALTKSGEYAQEQSTAYKAIKKQAHIQPQAAKLAFKLDGMEEAQRDDFLRGLNGLLKALNIFMPVDLVDQAEGRGATGEAVIPFGSRSKPSLATIPVGPADDSDLAGDDHAEAAE